MVIPSQIEMMPRSNSLMKKTICVDLDGVLADFSKGWQGINHIGDPIPGAVEFVKKLNELGRVVIFTCRCNPLINPERGLIRRVMVWLNKHGFEYDDVYSGIGKPIASAYIDDRAVHCDPIRFGEEDHRPYSGGLEEEWGRVMRKTKVLLERGDGFVSDSGTTV